MTVNFAICDDERPQAEILHTFVTDWVKKTNHFAAIDIYPSAEAFLFAYSNDKQYDILLLDIQMKQMDGISLAKQVRAANKEIQIIFITGYMDYIADGYDVEALHYLLKPVDKAKLHLVLDRAVDKLASNELALLISCAGVSTRIPLYEIRYLEVRHNYVTIHAAEDYLVKKTLNELERELDERFFRTGRSFIINLHYLRSVSRTDIMLKDGVTIPLSRGRYVKLNRALIDKR